jgi:two-component sensor histidine kinase
MLSILRDITEHRESRQRIEQLLREKELLLREVHHRIKNNMVTMRSLLSLQQNNVEDDTAREALQDAGNRLSGMMVLYEKLYRNDRMDSVAMDDFLKSLVGEIAGTFPLTVELSFEVPDLPVPAELATPLAIIVNELVTNAMKYAFHAGRENKLALTAVSEADGDDRSVVLSIQDNGEGFDPDSMSEGFGLGLVEVLCDQIRGRLSAKNVGGARFTVRFPL